MIERKLFIVNGLTGQETPVAVNQGAVPEDILKQVGLPGYQLARVRDRKVLQNDTALPNDMLDGEKFFAFEPMIVGGGTWEVC